MAISKSDKHELGKRERKRSEANAPRSDLILDEILILVLFLNSKGRRRNPRD